MIGASHPATRHGKQKIHPEVTINLLSSKRPDETRHWRKVRRVHHNERKKRAIAVGWQPSSDISSACTISNSAREFPALLVTATLREARRKTLKNHSIATEIFHLDEYVYRIHGYIVEISFAEPGQPAAPSNVTNLLNDPNIPSSAGLKYTGYNTRSTPYTSIPTHKP